MLARPAHGWDVAGAKWAGMQTAFIAGEGQQKFPLALPADIDVSDLAALADTLVAWGWAPPLAAEREEYAHSRGSATGCFRSFLALRCVG